jgi:toxin ParE1/3/4
MIVVWLEPAIASLAQVQEYISTDSPLTASRFTEDLYLDVSARLAQFPRIGRKIPEKDKDEYREIIHGNYRIMYKLADEEIRVLTVRNSKQLFTGEEID